MSNSKITTHPAKSKLKHASVLEQQSTLSYNINHYNANNFEIKEKQNRIKTHL